MPSHLKSNALTEGYDGVTAPAIPAAITVDAVLDTSTAFAQSSANSLRITATLSAGFFETTSAAGGGDGNDEIVGYFRFSHATGAEIIQLSLAHSGTLIGGAGGSGSAYAAFFRANINNLSAMYKWTAGALTELGTMRNGQGAIVSLLDTTTSFASGITYKQIFRAAQDQNGKRWLSCRLQRLSDNKWLQGPSAGSAGTWRTGQIECLQAQDDSITVAARKGGGVMAVSDTGHSLYHDDLQLNRVAPIGWHTYGDSLSIGYDAQNPWWVTLQDEIGACIQTHGCGGYQTFEVAHSVYSINPTPAHNSIISCGHNDQITGGYGSDATLRGYAKSALMAAICRCGLPIIVKAQAMTKGGTWSDDVSTLDSGFATAYDGATSCYSNVSGSTLTTTVNGSTVFVGYSGMDNTFTGTFKVKVDGADLATGTSDKSGIVTVNGRIYYCPQLLVITGLSSGTHTVVCETTNGTGNNYSWIDWVGGSEQATKPRVLVTTIPYMTSTQYVISGVSTANSDAYTADWTAAVYELAACGVNCGIVDITTGWIAADFVDPADDVHWNDAGHAHYKTRLAAAIATPGRRVKRLGIGLGL